MIDISYIEDEVAPSADEQPRVAAPVEPRPRWHRWAAFAAAGAVLIGLFAFASSRTDPPDRLKSADGVGVGEVYAVNQRFGQSFVRVTEITLTAATADGDPAALFVVEGRGWYSHQAATLTVQACDTRELTNLGSWMADDNGSFRFADTDSHGGDYHVTIEGLAAEPIRVLIGPAAQRVLGPLERGCPDVA